MSTGAYPIRMCDSEDGCPTWVLDDYAVGVSSVNGVRCEPIPPGWSQTPEGDDLCPEHTTAPAVAPASTPQEDVPRG